MKYHWFSGRAACRYFYAAGIFVFVVWSLLAAMPLFSAEMNSGQKARRFKAVLGGGLFFPVGKWSDGFDPGIALGGGVDFPLGDFFEIGGRFSRIELKMEETARIGWLTMEAQGTYYPPLELSSFEVFILGRAGLLRATLEVGEGREVEWDLMTGIGGGISLPISDNFFFQGTALWRKVLADAQGFSFEGGLQFHLF